MLLKNLKNYQYQKANNMTKAKETYEKIVLGKNKNKKPVNSKKAKETYKRIVLGKKSNRKRK